MKYVVCNLKNKLLKDDIVSYSQDLNQINSNNLKLIVCPSTPFLPFFTNDNYILGAQDISSFCDKTITGEITGEQLKSLDVKYVIIGHSERRLYNREINIDFINKINNAVNNNIKVIYCVGETLSQKENKETFDVIEKQISEVLNNVDIKDIMIAYEPVWSIGTGNVPDQSYILEIIDFIKMTVFEKYETNIDVLYGGSVNLDNINDIKNIKNLDGLLIGGASLNCSNINEIIKAIETHS